MTFRDDDQAKNAIIAAMPAPDGRRFASLCRLTELAPGESLCESDQRLRTAYFPLSGVISVSTSVDDRPPLELGLIGHDGMLGSTLSLGIPDSPMRAVVSGGGLALAIAVAPLKQAFLTNPGLLEAIHHYQFRLMMQVIQAAACLHFHEIEPRLARWLLMMQDLSNASTIYFTHRLLAQALGVRRSGITIAAGSLQRRDLIRYTRGKISVLDRAGLEGAACECHGILINKYRTLFATEQSTGNIVVC